MVAERLSVEKLTILVSLLSPALAQYDDDYDGSFSSYNPTPFIVPPIIFLAFLILIRCCRLCLQRQQEQEREVVVRRTILRHIIITGMPTPINANEQPGETTAVPVHSNHSVEHTPPPSYNECVTHNDREQLLAESK